MGDVLKGQLQQFVLGIADNVAQLAIDAQPASVRRDVREADGGLIEGGEETFLAVFYDTFRLDAPGDVLQHQQCDTLAFVPGDGNVDLQIIPPAVPRCRRRRRGDAPRWRGLQREIAYCAEGRMFAGAHLADGLPVQPEHVQEGGVGKQDREIIAERQQTGGHAGQELVGEGLEFDECAPIGMKIGIDREAHVEHDDLEQCIEDALKILGLARAQAPDDPEEPGRLSCVPPHVDLPVEKESNPKLAVGYKGSTAAGRGRGGASAQEPGGAAAPRRRRSSAWPSAASPALRRGAVAEAQVDVGQHEVAELRDRGLGAQREPPARLALGGAEIAGRGERLGDEDPAGGEIGAGVGGGAHRAERGGGDAELRLQAAEPEPGLEVAGIGRDLGEVAGAGLLEAARFFVDPRPVEVGEARRRV